MKSGSQRGCAPRNDGAGICISSNKVPCVCARGSYPGVPETAVLAFRQYKAKRVLGAGGFWLLCAAAVCSSSTLSTFVDGFPERLRYLHLSVLLL